MSTAAAIREPLAIVRQGLELTPASLGRRLMLTTAEVEAVEAGWPIQDWHREHVQAGLVALGLLRFWRPARGGYERGDGARVAPAAAGVTLLWPRAAPGPRVPDPQPDSGGPILRRDVVQLMLAAEKARPCRIHVSEMPRRCPGCGHLNDDGRVWCRACHGNGCRCCVLGMTDCDVCRGPHPTYSRPGAA